MGQPDLIYKFMDLANHQAALNSKRGAAYGFSKIAKQAGDALQPHLHLLIPRLIRYQYDPEKNVQVKTHSYPCYVQIYCTLVFSIPFGPILQNIFYTILQDAMVRIWKSLITDSKKTIDGHLDLIMDDLLTQCGSRLWRSREASCLALADIIQGRKFDQVMNCYYFQYLLFLMNQKC